MHYRVLGLVLALSLFQGPDASALKTETTVTSAAQKNLVVIDHTINGDVDFVRGTIFIPQTAERIWPILANPYEFETITSRVKVQEVLEDTPEKSLMKCKVEIGFFIPDIHYTVESHYDKFHSIEFKSKGGDLKDFRGEWTLHPAPGGVGTQVTYAMHVVPGIPMPQWLVRQGLRFELPNMLQGLSNRVDAIYVGKNRPASKSLLASASLL